LLVSFQPDKLTVNENTQNRVFVAKKSVRALGERPPRAAILRITHSLDPTGIFSSRENRCDPQGNG
jgi:hypothetical protein